jgi:hypothetical protein
VVGVFTSFTLSQSGMVQHWRKLREEEPRWRRNAIVNGVGAFTTFTVLLVVLRTKFMLGAWIVVVAIPILIFGLTRVHRHYMAVRVNLRDPWARAVGLLPTSPFLETLPKEGSLADSVKRYITDLRQRIPAEDFITVTLPERIRPGPVMLGSQTALRLKTALLFTPDVVLTNVPYIEGKEHLQDPLEHGRDIRHVVILLVAAAHNATLRGLEYARTLDADEVRAVHVVLDPEMSDHHEAEWEALDTGLPLEFIESPYRDLDMTLRDYVRPIASDGRTVVTLVLPEFVVKKFSWHHLLHNQNAFGIKRLFLSEPDVIVTSVPYHLE